MVVPTKSTPLAATSPSKSPSKIIIRRARLRDAPATGRLAATTYDCYPKTLSSWLNPHRHKCWDDYERGFVERAIKRLLDPRTLSFVAVPSSTPSVIVGYVTITRQGDDAGAKRQIASRDTWLLRILAWVVWSFYLVKNWVVGKDRAVDAERQREFDEANQETEADHWGVEGRKNRWHVQSMIVDEGWQKRGIGAMLMAEVIAKSEEEGVIVGLEASEQGELLYRKVGFELLARFKPIFGLMTDADPDVGGHFVYTPTKLRKEKA